MQLPTDFKSKIAEVCVCGGGGDHCRITDCKLDSVVDADAGNELKLGPVLFGPNDLHPAVSSAQPATQLRHR